MKEAANTGRGLFLVFDFVSLQKENIVYAEFVVVLEESSNRRCGTKEGLLVNGCFVVLYFVVAVVEEELVVAEMMKY